MSEAPASKPRRLENGISLERGGPKRAFSEAPASKPRRVENGCPIKRGLANRPYVRCRLASRPACRSRRSSSTSRPRRCYLDAFLTDTKHLVKGVPQTRCSGIRLPRGGSHGLLFKSLFNTQETTRVAPTRATPCMDMHGSTLVYIYIYIQHASIYVFILISITIPYLASILLSLSDIDISLNFFISLSIYNYSR